jgi:inner membrane protein involved in colicin E2 resistance
MARNVAALVLIFIATSFAWVILGTTIMARTDSTSSGLESKVASSWGRPQQQTPPVVYTSRFVQRVSQETINGQTISKTVLETVTTPLPLEQTRIDTALNLDQRQKGLLWFATYRVAFRGTWTFRNSSDNEAVTVKVALPVPDAVYDDIVFRIDGQTVPFSTANGAVSATVRRERGSVIRLDFGYRSQGLNSWEYSFGKDAARVHDFVLAMTTDFAAIDFPQGTLSPASKQRRAGGWLLTWKYSDVVTGARIGMAMPQKLQPGPLAQRISFFAPVSLLFFFFAMFVITALRKIHLHPMHYFFLATSFFAFHLLLAYLVDHISIHAAFVACSAVSIFLVVSYLRIVVGPKFAFREAALAQLIYLVGFSYAFFFEGFTGLTVTIGAILSLFVVMQMTARVEWGRSPSTVPDGLAVHSTS